MTPINTWYQKGKGSQESETTCLIPVSLCLLLLLLVRVKGQGFCYHEMQTPDGIANVGVRVSTPKNPMINIKSSLQVEIMFLTRFIKTIIETAGSMMHYYARRRLYRPIQG